MKSKGLRNCPICDRGWYSYYNYCEYVELKSVCCYCFLFIKELLKGEHDIRDVYYPVSIGWDNKKDRENMLMIDKLPFKQIQNKRLIKKNLELLGII